MSSDFRVSLHTIVGLPHDNIEGIVTHLQLPRFYPDDKSLSLCPFCALACQEKKTVRDACSPQLGEACYHYGARQIHPSINPPGLRCEIVGIFTTKRQSDRPPFCSRPSPALGSSLSLGQVANMVAFFPGSPVSYDFSTRASTLSNGPSGNFGSVAPAAAAANSGTCTSSVHSLPQRLSRWPRCAEA